MRFNCGTKKKKLTHEEIIAKRQAHREYMMNWHLHFAWLPVRIAENECAWLETVERRFPNAGAVKRFMEGTGSPYYSWRWFTPEYRAYKAPDYSRDGIL